MPRSLQVPAAPSYDEWEGLLSLRQMEKQISSQGQGGGRHDICKRRRRIKEELMGWSELLPLGRTPSIWGVTEITADAHIMEDNDSSTRLGTNNPNTAEQWSFITKSKKSQNTSLNRLSLSLCTWITRSGIWGLCGFEPETRDPTADLLWPTYLAGFSQIHTNITVFSVTFIHYIFTQSPHGLLNYFS